VTEITIPTKKEIKKPAAITEIRTSAAAITEIKNTRLTEIRIPAAITDETSTITGTRPQGRQKYPTIMEIRIPDHNGDKNLVRRRVIYKLGWENI